MFFKHVLARAQNVKFPLTLDMYEFCTEDLRQKLNSMRKRFEAQSQREIDERVWGGLHAFGTLHTHVLFLYPGSRDVLSSAFFCC